MKSSSSVIATFVAAVACTAGTCYAQTDAECRAKLAAHENEVGRTAARPLPPGNIPPMRRLMWHLAERIKLVEQYCPANIQRDLLWQLQTSYSQTEKACKAIASATASCTPSAY